MHLFDIIEEQFIINFIGRINVILKDNHQHKGTIFFNNGIICGAEYKKANGKTALYNLTFNIMFGPTKFAFIIEPEIVDNSRKEFELNFQEYYIKAKELYKTYTDNNALRPPLQTKIFINHKQTHNAKKYSVLMDTLASSINHHEFLLLCTLVNYSITEDVYYNTSELLDFEITSALIGLKAKNLITIRE